MEFIFSFSHHFFFTSIVASQSILKSIAHDDFRLCEMFRINVLKLLPIIYEVENSCYSSIFNCMINSVEYPNKVRMYTPLDEIPFSPKNPPIILLHLTYSLFLTGNWHSLTSSSSGVVCGSL